MAAKTKHKEKKQHISKLSNRAKLKIYGKHQAGIGNSSKGHAFSEFRKLKAVNEYRKFKRKHQKIRDGGNEDLNDETWQSKPKSHGVRNFAAKSKLNIARKKYELERAEKGRLRKEAEKLREKHTEDLKQKEEKRRETNKRLNQRTKRGQPIMANHIECLLEKIEKG